MENSVALEPVDIQKSIELSTKITNWPRGSSTIFEEGKKYDFYSFSMNDPSRFEYQSTYYIVAQREDWIRARVFNKDGTKKSAESFWFHLQTINGCWTRSAQVWSPEYKEANV